jgi:hypothetical protein
MRPCGNAPGCERRKLENRKWKIEERKGQGASSFGFPANGVTTGRGSVNETRELQVSFEFPFSSFGFRISNFESGNAKAQAHIL